MQIDCMHHTKNKAEKGFLWVKTRHSHSLAVCDLFGDAPNLDLTDIAAILAFVLSILENSLNRT